MIVFRTASSAIQTLYTVIDLGIDSIDQTLPVAIVSSGEGFEEDYLYVSLNGNMTFYRSVLYPAAILKPVTDFPTN